MIERNDISQFFELEAEAARESWEALMKLSIKERIHKRKAISAVYLDKEYSETSEESYQLFKVTFAQNLSDFKEGDSLLLHKETSTLGIKCTITKFESDNSIIIEVFPPNIPSDIKTYYDVPLCLDKDYVDMRPRVYDNFMVQLPGDKEFWYNTILNTKAAPKFENREECEAKLQQVVETFGLNLLPSQREAIINSIAAKDYYLIQGPPGTGKSFVLSCILLMELVCMQNKVIVIGPNHMAINNALIQTVKNFKLCYPAVHKVGQTYNAPNYSIELGEGDDYLRSILPEDCGDVLPISNVPQLNVSYINTTDRPKAIGLTSHSLYTRRARGLQCDTLVIDEAGQMTIPLALMGMIKADKVIFAGDYKQLPPIVSSEKVKDELRKSVFQALITKENCTMLDVSFRMCEPICNFVSELFYDGELKPFKLGCGDMVITNEPMYSFDTPIVIRNVEDSGKQVSDKEAEQITSIISGYLDCNLSAKDIAVLSPFRAQAANIRRYLRKALPEEYVAELAVDTIDKMQGQEREVIIYSLAAGDMEYMTEMGDFLYNPNKMNVAFSRAKSKLIIVGNITNLRRIDHTTYPHIDRMLNSKYVKQL